MESSFICGSDTCGFINCRKAPIPINAKALFKIVAKQFDSALVIGADTIVVRGKTVLGKPESMDNAMEYIKLLNGSKHEVYTGICIIDSTNNKVVTGHERTSVVFRRLTDEQIHLYLSCTGPLDKAGAYAIQGPGALLVERIEGCYYNVVGLPLFRLAQMLKKVGLTFYPKKTSDA